MDTTTASFFTNAATRTAANHCNAKYKYHKNQQPFYPHRAS